MYELTSNATQTMLKSVAEQQEALCKKMGRGFASGHEAWARLKQLSDEAYVELAGEISYKNAGGDIVNANHEAIGNKALAFVGTSGVQMGWLASQADMLADDWKIVE